MKFALSTHWNSRRHTTGEALVEEVITLGFDQIEMGYNLQTYLVPGIKKMVDERAIKVTSVHNFCPVPPAAPEGHPEVYTLASSSKGIRDAAVRYTARTIRFAAEVGARIVIIHCGNVEMKNYTKKLIQLYKTGKRLSNLYEKTKFDLLLIREKKVKVHLNHLVNGLNQLKPVLLDTGIRLGLENLPSWEGIPTEPECHSLLKELGKDCFCYWHDIGHSQIKESLGLVNQLKSLQALAPFLGGMHIHDVASGINDHLMPPMGSVDFSRLQKFAQANIIRVLEPSPKLTFCQVARGLAILKDQWQGKKASE